MSRISAIHTLTREQLVKMGFSPEQIDEALPHNESGPATFFKVRVENWPTLEVFLGCSKRWDIDAVKGLYKAINAPSMGSVMEMLRMPGRERPRAFRDLEAMQEAALPILNKGR